MVAEAGPTLAAAKWQVTALVYLNPASRHTAQFKKEAAPPEMGGTASGVETTDLSGGGQAAISRGAGESSLALLMGVRPSPSSSSCSVDKGSAGSAKRITSGTQAIARSRTSTSVM
jgi:hypothetical protein